MTPIPQELPPSARADPSAVDIGTDVLRMLVAIAVSVAFVIAVVDIDSVALRGAGAVLIALWGAEMVLGAVTGQYRRASPSLVRAGTAALAVSQVGACLLSFPTGGGLLPVVVAGVVRLVRRPDQRTAVIGGVLAADALALVVSALVTGARPEMLVLHLAACGGAALIGALRALRLRTAQKERALLREQIAVQRERAENAALVERARIARDLHDVLAHSLGALTLQLDAALALTEAGRYDELGTRLRRARGLAADGLAESRDAVAALREPPRDLVGAITALAEEHRRSGGEVRLRGLLADPPTGAEPAAPCELVLDADRIDALRRAAQEMLTNARRHAPGGAVDLDLDAAGGSARLTARVDAGAPGSPSPDLIGERRRPGGPGGGYGLRGMRERCEAVGGGAEAHRSPDGIVETIAHVPLGTPEEHR